MDVKQFTAAWRSVCTSLDRGRSDSLIGYAYATYPRFEAPAHIREIASALEEVERGELDRLIVVMPPRHGKSTTISELFPAWWMGRSPRSQIIHAGYGQEFIRMFGRRVRNRMESSQHLSIFPASRLDPASRAVDDWSTEAGGAYCAVGAGAGVTGRGANLIVVDDPIAGREDADSEIMREKLWDWWTNDLSTRMTRVDGRAPAVIVIQTRWHEDDFVGRLLMQQADGGDQWRVLHYPAVDDEGNSLWPERYSVEFLEATKKRIGQRAWQSLYQGNPAPDGGSYFREEWIIPGDPPPREEMNFYGASDYAISERQGADYTVHAVLGVDASDRLWLIDLWRRRAATGMWVSAAVDLMEKYRPRIWGEEKGVIIKSIGPWMAKTMQERKVYTTRHQLPAMADKETRARTLQGLMESRGLYIPRHAHFRQQVEHELLNFPAARHDDIVDAVGLAARLTSAAGRRKRMRKMKTYGQMTWNDLIEGAVKRRELREMR